MRWQRFNCRVFVGVFTESELTISHFRMKRELNQIRIRLKCLDLRRSWTGRMGNSTDRRPDFCPDLLLFSTCKFGRPTEHYPSRKSSDFRRKIMKDRHLERSFGIDGAVSSVVEHYLDTVGVTGSNPVSRTILQFLLSLHGAVL